jgi:DtxR family Mn-dependent transcriptional regulator
LCKDLVCSNVGVVVAISTQQASQCCGLKPTVAVEDALKTIFKMVGQGEPATTSALAQRLGVTAPSVSVMLKRLTAHGLVQRDVAQTATLTEHGSDHAKAVIRRHRLLETFLARVLDVPWDEVHAEAETLEHAVSDRLLARIDEHLGHPIADPHGDPIPPPSGVHSEQWGERLNQAEAGVEFRVERVDDRDSAALRYLACIGIRPGVELEVVERAPFGGPLWLRVNGRDEALGEQLTTMIYGTSSASTRATPAVGEA